MKTHLAWAMVGLLGCGAQELPTGSRDAGRDLGRRVIDATGRNLDDAGCPPGKIVTCGPLGGCGGSKIILTATCFDGVWTCPIVPIICPADAGNAADGGG